MRHTTRIAAYYIKAALMQQLAHILLNYRIVEHWQTSRNSGRQQPNHIMRLDDHNWKSILCRRCQTSARNGKTLRAHNKTHRARVHCATDGHVGHACHASHDNAKTMPQLSCHVMRGFGMQSSDSCLGHHRPDSSTLGVLKMKRKTTAFNAVCA